MWLKYYISCINLDSFYLKISIKKKNTPYTSRQERKMQRLRWSSAFQQLDVGLPTCLSETTSLPPSLPTRREASDIAPGPTHINTVWDYLSQVSSSYVPDGVVSIMPALSLSLSLQHTCSSLHYHEPIESCEHEKQPLLISSSILASLSSLQTVSYMMHLSADRQ